MDPDATLMWLREMAGKCLDGGEEGEVPPGWFGDAHEALCAFVALDVWLSGGGFAPRAWRPRPAPARVVRSWPRVRAVAVSGGQGVCDAGT